MFSISYTLKVRRNADNSYPDLYNPEINRGDSGVDLYVPEDVVVPAGGKVKIRLGVHCEMLKKCKITFPAGGEYTLLEPVGFLLFPRSSIYKTPLRLANSIGLIDSGYRGELMACVDNISDSEYMVEKGTRLFQIVNSDLSSFDNIQICDELSEP